MRAEAKKPIKPRKTGAKLYASTGSKPLVALRSSASAKQLHFKGVQTRLSVSEAGFHIRKPGLLALWLKDGGWENAAGNPAGIALCMKCAACGAEKRRRGRGFSAPARLRAYGSRFHLVFTEKRSNVVLTIQHSRARILFASEQFARDRADAARRPLAREEGNPEWRKTVGSGSASCPTSSESA